MGIGCFKCAVDFLDVRTSIENSKSSVYLWFLWMHYTLHVRSNCFRQCNSKFTCKPVTPLGKLRDLPGQDTDADDAIVQCCGSEPYLSTQAACYNDVITPFIPRKVKSKDAACDTVDSCPSKLPHTCTFSPAKDDCCPFFQCLNSGK